MIIIHRITPLLIGLATAGGFVLFERGGHPFLWGAVTLVLCALLFGRLLGWQGRSFQFWSLFGLPLLFLLSSLGLYLFLQGDASRIALSVVTALLLFFLAEHVFAFVHLPASYRPYSLEHFSLVLAVLAMFFAGATGLGLRLLVQVPLLLLSAAVFPFSFSVIYATLWASKAEHDRARPLALMGALAVTELFAALSFLPTGFYAGAAVVAIGAYLYLSLSRAQLARRLNARLAGRYAAAAIAMTTVIAATAKWT